MMTLVVETLHAKLQRLLPGAEVRERRQLRDALGAGKPVTPEEAWEVSRGVRVLARGATEREAVDRALFLWASR
jgi:hypothetical protein